MSRDEPGYKELIAPLEDRMMRCVWRIVRKPDDAEDALQDALLAIWKHWGEVRRHPNPQALVLRMCINAAHDALRRRVRWSRRDGGEAPESIPDASPPVMQVLSGAEQNAQVLRAIGLLPKNHAQAILMHVVEEMPYSDIAEVMDCREATVRKYVERARTRLRALLSPLVPENHQEESIHA